MLGVQGYSIRYELHDLQKSSSSSLRVRTMLSCVFRAVLFVFLPRLIPAVLDRAKCGKWL